MKAVVFHGIGDIRIDTVPDPEVADVTDAVVRLTASAICGTDLHMVRGTLGGMKPGTILGHEGVGIVETVGRDVRNLKRGDRGLIPSTIACGSCVYCRAGYTAQCDVANPGGPRASRAMQRHGRVAAAFGTPSIVVACGSDRRRRRDGKCGRTARGGETSCHVSRCVCSPGTCTAII